MGWNNEAWKPDRILVEPAFLQVGKKTVFSELFQDPAYDFYVWLARILDVDQNVVQIYNNENVKLLSEDLVNVPLEASQWVEKAKRHDLILEEAVPSSESGLSFIAFSNPHPLVGTG